MQRHGRCQPGKRVLVPAAVPLWTDDVRCSSAAALNPGSAASKEPLGSALVLGGPDGREHCGGSSSVIVRTVGRPLFLSVICAASPELVLNKSAGGMSPEGPTVQLPVRAGAGKIKAKLEKS